MQISDLTSPAFYENPYPIYKQLREADPIVSLAPNIWMTGRYSVVESVLRDKRIGRSYMQGVRAQYGDIRAKKPIFRSFENMLLMMDSPRHTRLRGLLAKAFNAKQESGFRQLTQTIVDKLIDRISTQESFDIVKDYAMPMPLKVICSMLDVPFENSTIFSKATDAIAQNFEIVRMRGAELNAANCATEELENYFIPILHERRKKPGDDLISLMVLADVDADKLTDAEILSNIILLFFAGHETTANMIGNALIALHQHPEVIKEVTSTPSLISNVVAECLRYDGSVQLSGRIALEDLEIEGEKIECGDHIFAFLGSANHDPEKFKDADKLIIGRNLPKNWHISFGTGIHNCLGARLAMIEMEVALGTLFKRLPNIKITNLAHLRWRQRNTLRGVESLTALTYAQ